MLLPVALLNFRAMGAILTVNTTDNVSPGAGETSLLQALGQVKAGDEIRFNISGPGPHYIATPLTGYPWITNSNVTIDGYSQPGAAPNTNRILAPNTAKIQVVLDSRQGGYKTMAFPLTAPNDDRGYEVADGALLGVVDAQGVRVQGLSFLGVPQVGTDAGVALHFIAFGRGGSGQVSGCWLGVDPDGKTVAGASQGITGLRYRGRDAANTVTNTMLVNHLTIGVTPKATNAVQQFNVLVGMPAIPIAVEGDGTRISGNFITVLPDGLHDYDVALDPTLSGHSLGAIEIGRGGNNTVIGVDGDGVNDENERNVFGGQLPMELDGYLHLIEFYGQNPGTNVVFAGNYVGVGIDGKTRFTNGVPVLNGSGPAAQYRIGSNFDGVSDALEGNLIANNYPPELFPPADYTDMAESLGFLSQLNPGATVSLRGNTLINNFPFPTSPLRDGGAFLASYYSQALADPAAGVSPVLDATSTHLRLKGTVPVANPSLYTQTTVDVYIADPEGIQTGTDAAIAGLPQGFVQGLSYLGSFVEGSAADLDKKAGAFEFDITKLNVPVGTKLTITANYSAPAGVTPPPAGGGDLGTFTGLTRGADGSITLTWSGGTLQSAATVDGPWSEETTTGNSFTTTPTDLMKFFRVQSGGGETGGPLTPGAPLTSPFSNAVDVR